MKQKQKLNELRIGSILTYINLFISFIIPLFYTPVMLRILGQSEYGLYSLSNSVIGYLSLLNFGLGTAVIRYVTKCRVEHEHEKLESVVGLFILIYSILALLVLVVGFCLTQFSGTFFGKGLNTGEIDRLQILLIIMTISTAVSFPVSVYSSVAVAYEKYIFRKTFDSITTIAAPVLNLVVLFLGYASIGMALVGLGLQIVYLIVFPAYCRRKLNVRMRLKNLPVYMLKEILGFSAFIFLSSIVDMLYWATDKVLIGAMIGSVAVAIYNVGGTFTSMLQNMSSAISGVFGTRVTAMVLSETPMDELSALLVRIGRLQYLIVALFLSGYVVFGQAFIHFWAGDGYHQAYYVGLMAMIPLAVPLIQNIAFATIVAQNKHRFRSIIYAIIAVANVVSTFLCIPKFGILGASACTAIAFIVGNGIIMNIYYYKVTGLDIPFFWKNILRMSVVPVVLSGISLVFISYIRPIQTLVEFLIYVIVFLLVYLLLIWFTTMNNYEKSIFKDMFAKIPGIKKLFAKNR